MAFDASGARAAIHVREEIHERFRWRLMWGTSAGRIGFLMAKWFEPIAGTMRVTGAADVDRRDQHVAGALALRDVRMARRAIQQAMRFVMELAVNQPARRNVRGDDSPIGQRRRRFLRDRFDFVAVTAAAGRFVSELTVSMLLSNRFRLRDIVEHFFGLFFREPLEVTMSGKRTRRTWQLVVNFEFRVPNSECFQRVCLGEKATDDVGRLVRDALTGEAFVIEQQRVTLAAVSLERDRVEVSAFVVRFVTDVAASREVDRLAILADQSANKLTVGVVLGLQMHGMIEANAAAVLPARLGVAGTLEVFDREVGSVLGIRRQSVGRFGHERLQQKFGMPVALIEARDTSGEDVTAAVSCFQVRVASDAVPAAGLSQHRGSFVLLMAGGARDVAMSGDLARVMLGDAMTRLALLVVDRMKVIAE